MSRNTEPTRVFTPAELAKYIDHTQLRPGVSDSELRQACEEAREYGFYSVCVYWDQMEKVSGWLSGSPVLPIAVVGFPSGTVPTEQKVSETRTAVAAGAKEIDMVIHRDLLRSGNDEAVCRDIQGVVQAAGVPVKVILETSELDEAEKKRACALAKKAGAAFVKTSTGFSKGGATVEDVALMRAEVGSQMGVKASGGIRSYETAVAMIQAGASRLGCSASVAIVQGAVGQGEGY